jgi:hypothetical protein
MKLSKIYSLKKSKSNEIISFKFPFINNRYRKTTRRVDHSLTRRLPDLATPRLGESLREKKQHRNRLFAHEGCLSPSEISKKRFFAQKRPLNLSKVYC